MPDLLAWIHGNSAGVRPPRPALDDDDMQACHPLQAIPFVSGKDRRVPLKIMWPRWNSCISIAKISRFEKPCKKQQWAHPVMVPVGSIQTEQATPDMLAPWSLIGHPAEPRNVVRDAAEAIACIQDPDESCEAAMLVFEGVVVQGGQWLVVTALVFEEIVPLVKGCAVGRRKWSVVVDGVVVGGRWLAVSGRRSVVVERSSRPWSKSEPTWV